jgi:hypothetical protein
MSFFIVALLLRLRFGVLFSAFSAMFLYFRGSDLANGEGWNGKIRWLLCRSFDLFPDGAWVGIGTDSIALARHGAVWAALLLD